MLTVLAAARVHEAVRRPFNAFSSGPSSTRSEGAGEGKEGLVARTVFLLLRLVFDEADLGHSRMLGFLNLDV